MDDEAKEPDEPLGVGRRESIASSGSLVAFEFWFVWAVEDEYGLDGRAEETDESVEESSDGGVGAAAGCLVLELPDGNVNGDAIQPVVLRKAVGCELGQ